MKITNSLVKTLTPSSKQYEIWDSEVKGFLVRVNTSGTTTYYCQFSKNRKIKIARTTIMTANQAREEAKKIINMWANGDDPALKRKKPQYNNEMSLNKFIDQYYTQWSKIHHKSANKILTRIKFCFAKNIGELPLCKITHQIIDTWRNNRLRHAKNLPATVNRDLTSLSSILSYAKELGLINDNPLKHLKRLKINSNINVRYLSAQEERALRQELDNRENKIRAQRISANKWRAKRGYALLPSMKSHEFADHVKPMVLLSLNTGLRRGELLQLCWDMINFDEKIITITNQISKTGKIRHIPLNSEAFTILHTWRQQKEKILTNDLVFSNHKKAPFHDIKSAWRNLLIAANISNFRWHDMRHHFASKLVMAGVDLNTVRELLGHSDIKMTLRYAHLAPEHKARAVEKLVIT
jgi:integrase